jgi:pimeloyl-ACP methyl ester carboxylesterase
MPQSISHLSPKPIIAQPSRFKRWRWYLVATYLLLLLLSYGVRTMNANNNSYQPRQGEQSITVLAVDGNQLGSQEVRLAYKEYGNEPREERATIVLLHGSPGSSRVFTNFAAHLASTYRVILPDLPGFGNSTRQIPDYSVRAHAQYVFQLLDELNIEQAHLLGFSMGGGVAIDMAGIAPERVSSITMLSAIGVQEMELLGDYYLNHAVHGMQLGFLWLLREGVPHGGLWDNTFLVSSMPATFMIAINVHYAPSWSNIRLLC